MSHLCRALCRSPTVRGLATPSPWPLPSWDGAEGAGPTGAPSRGQAPPRATSRATRSRIRPHRLPCSQLGVPLLTNPRPAAALATYNHLPDDSWAYQGFSQPTSLCVTLLFLPKSTITTSNSLQGAPGHPKNAKMPSELTQHPTYSRTLPPIDLALVVATKDTW